jgi:aspartyl-tRNA(Asn)/glutamyl-tRNA(Gln) amidotransferase subunit B
VELAEACDDGKLASNWVQQDVLRSLRELQVEIDRFPVSAAALAELLTMVQAGKLATSRAREVLSVMLDSGKSAEAAMQSAGIEEVDNSVLEALCRELLDANPKIVAQVKQGKTKAAGALIGQAKRRNPNVDPARVQNLCLELIEKM